MELLHRSLLSAHQVDDLPHYRLLLSLFHNLRAAEAVNALQRYERLLQLSRTLDNASFSLLHSIIKRRRSSVFNYSLPGR